MLHKSLFRFKSTPILLFAFLIFANLQSETAAAPPTTDKALQVYQRMNGFYKQLRSTTLKASFKYDAEPSKNVDLAMKRPNCFALITRDKTWGCAASNGEKLLCYSPIGNLFSIRQAPHQFDDIFKTRDFSGSVVLCANWSINDLLAGRAPAWLGDSPKGRYLGEHKLGNRKCHHLLFEEGSVAAKTREFWIDAGPEPWLLKEKYAMITVDYLDQKKDPLLNATKFSYTPPTNAKKVLPDTLWKGLIPADFGTAK